MQRIQLVAIAVSLSFLAYVLRQIQKGRLREEYAFIWIVSTFALILFSFWRNALELLAGLFGVHDPPNLLFTGAIMATLLYLLHLSLTVSKLQHQNKTLAQEIALLREKMDKNSKNI